MLSIKLNVFLIEKKMLARGTGGGCHLFIFRWWAGVGFKRSSTASLVFLDIVDDQLSIFDVVVMIPEILDEQNLRRMAVLRGMFLAIASDQLGVASR